jgi:hypothetical protein
MDDALFEDEDGSTRLCPYSVSAPPSGAFQQLRSLARESLNRVY